jgi:D-alanyl-lipoteichoic acid acyltransferase DltB (MBOAT superfamily)
VIFIESTAEWLNGLERLLRFTAPPFVNRAFVSRTPGEFWYRYNVRVHDWLYHNVFVLSGGRRKPLRGVMLVFVVSAIFHELFFGIATSRFTGYQATFFLLQIPAVAISPRMDRLAKAWGNLGRMLARVITILWFVATSVLFFHGIDQVFYFYYASEPWLK